MKKNYFLFQQAFNYEENLTYTNRLSLLLSREQDNLTKAIGPKNYDRFLNYLTEYAQLMQDLHRRTCTDSSCLNLQARIREVGQNLLLFADQLVTSERRDIHQRLQQMITPAPVQSDRPGGAAGLCHILYRRKSGPAPGPDHPGIRGRGPGRLSEDHAFRRLAK